MTYRLLATETFTAGVSRVGAELVDDSLARLDRPQPDTLEKDVHEVRKNCKKLRGLARLVRPAVGDDYAESNRAFRNASRQLSPYRDAHALLETFDALVIASGAGSDALGSVRAGLARRARESTERLASDRLPLERARDWLDRGKVSLAQWTPEADVDLLAEAIERPYKRGRGALKASARKPRADKLHGWRKRAKYTWYQLRLLRDAAPSLLAPLASAYHDLTDALGDDHDLALMTTLFRRAPEAFGGKAAVEQAQELARAHRSDMQDRAFRLGRRLYTERPKRFSARVAGYWEVWQQHGDERPAGEIADLHAANDELVDRTASQLHSMARDLDVPGRSSMRRDELEAAVRAAGGRGD